jgi:hypothetical protein
MMDRLYSTQVLVLLPEPQDLAELDLQPVPHRQDSALRLAE